MEHVCALVVEIHFGRGDGTVGEYEGFDGTVEVVPQKIGAAGCLLDVKNPLTFLTQCQHVRLRSQVVRKRQVFVVLPRGSCGLRGSAHLRDF